MSCGCRDGVFGAETGVAVQAQGIGQCNLLAIRAIYNPSEIWSDSGYFSTRFVEQAALVYESGGDNKLYEFRICTYNAITASFSKCSGWPTSTPTPGTPPICFDPQAYGRTALSSRLAVLAQRAKITIAAVNATKTLTSTVPGKLTSDLPLIGKTSVVRGVSSVTRSRVGTKAVPLLPTLPMMPPTPENPIPMPRPGVTDSDFVSKQSQVSLEEKEFGGYKYVAASLADAGSMIAVLSLAGQAGTKVTGTKDFSGARWSVINSNTTAESNDPALLLSGLVANGDAIVMTTDAESVYITGTKFIEKAAELCPPGQSEIFVLQDPAPGWQTAGGQEPPAATSDGTPPSNTMLYVGLGVGAAALIGVGVYFATRKQ
jgi:hypothetical protein